MKTERTEVFFATGLPSDHGWSRAWECDFPIGTLRICLSFSGKHARSQGGSYRHALQQATPETTEQLYQVFIDLISKAELANLRCNLVAVIVVGHVMTAFSYHGVLILERQGARKEILGLTQEFEVREGKVLLNDRLLLCTQEAWQDVKSLLEKVESLDNLEKFVQQSDTLIKISEKSSTAAIIGLEFVVDEQQGVGLERSTTLTVEKKKVSSGKFSLFLSIFRILFLLIVKIWQLIVELIVILLRSIKWFLSGLKALLFLVFKPKTTKVGVHFAPKKLVLVVVLLFCLLLISIFISFRYYQSTSFEKQVKSELQPFQEKLLRIEQSSDINPLQSRSDLVSLMNEVTSLEKKFDNNHPGYNQITSFIIQIQSTLDGISSVHELSELPVYKDLRVVSPTFIGSSISSNKESAVILDSQQQFLINLDFASRDAKEVVLPADIEARAVSTQDSLVYFLGDGIWSLNSSSTEDIPKNLMKADDYLADATVFSIYSSYLYLLNSSQRAVYRYSLGPSSISGRSTWVSASSGVPFDKITSMVVDGSIWLGTSEGRVIQLKSGSVTPFAMETIPEPTNSNLYLAAHEDLDYLFILEPAQNRIIFVEKSTGNVVTQIQNSSLGSANSLIIDQVNNQLLALSGSLLFSVPIMAN